MNDFECHKCGRARSPHRRWCEACGHDHRGDAKTPVMKLKPRPAQADNLFTVCHSLGYATVETAPTPFGHIGTYPLADLTLQQLGGEV